jgi:hypothetical protein
MQNLHLRVCGLTKMISANNNTVMWHKVATNLLIVLTPIGLVVFISWLCLKQSTAYSSL